MIHALIFIILGGLIAYGIFYSPRAQIKWLWKKIFRIAVEIGKIRRQSAETANYLQYKYDEESDRTGKMINALLEYYFDPERDYEYIKQNKYEIKRPSKLGDQLK